MPELSHKRWLTWTVRRAASGGAFAPEPPHTTCNQPESIWSFGENNFPPPKKSDLAPREKKKKKKEKMGDKSV